MDNLWLKVENIVAKGEILSNFFFCHYVFKLASVEDLLNIGKGLRLELEKFREKSLLG